MCQEFVNEIVGGGLVCKETFVHGNEILNDPRSRPQRYFCEIFKVRKIIFLLKDFTLPTSEAERSLV